MHRTIRARVAFTVVLIIIVAIAVTTFSNVYYMGSQLMADERELIQTQADKYSEDVENFIIKGETLVKDISNCIVASGSIEEDDVLNILYQYFYNTDDLFNLFVGTEDGQAYFGKKDYKKANDYDPRTRNWYRQAKAADATIITDPYKSFAYDVILTTFAAPIYINNEFVGVVGCDVELDYIVNLINGIDYSKGAYGTLIDSQGYFVVHPNEEYEPKTDGTTKVEAVMPQVQELIDNPGSKIIESKNYDGRKMYFASSKVEDSGWVIGIATPKENVIKDIQHEVIVTLLIGLICLMVAAFIMAFMVRRLLSPINKMVDAMERLSEGDFNVKLDFRRHDDELAKLQNSMSNLVGILSAVIEQENYILGEIAVGNLDVEEMEDLPGQFDDLALSVNSISATVNELIKDIQFSAMNVQSVASGLEVATDPEEIQAVVEALTAEANTLMEKISVYKTK